MFVREANVSELDTLSRLVYYSEKSLGFDEDYMKIFKDKYNVSKGFLESSHSYCLIDKDEIVGFFGLQKNDLDYELEFFYINSDCQGLGYGKAMFGYLTEKCKELNIKSFYLVTSPESMEFYTKLGAVKIGDTISLINEKRIIPRLKYEL